MRVYRAVNPVLGAPHQAVDPVPNCGRSIRCIVVSNPNGIDAIVHVHLGQRFPTDLASPTMTLHVPAEETLVVPCCLDFEADPVWIFAQTAIAPVHFFIADAPCLPRCGCGGT